MAHEKYPDTPGGEVVVIQVLVNGKLEYYRAAALTTTNPGGVSRYKTDDGRVVSHRREAGYKALAAQLIDP